MPIRVILDTDIGTDVDDCVALALLLRSPEVTLEGVTCVYGDVALRARMVMKLLRLHGGPDAPVLTGARTPLLGRVPVYWEGREGEGLLEPRDVALKPADGHAADFLAQAVMANPGQIHLLAIGPLTNVALALLREPGMAKALAGLTIMGGAARGPESYHLAVAEHNIRCDPEAAHVVFTSGAPITLIPLDVTMQTHIDAAGAAHIRRGGTPFHDAVARQVDLYLEFKRRASTAMHDPLAAAVVFCPDLVQTYPLRVDVETAGLHTSGMTVLRAPKDTLRANAQVALRVDAPRFEALLLDRLARPL